MDRKDKVKRIESFMQELEDIRDKAVTSSLPGVVVGETVESISDKIDDAIDELSRSLEELKDEYV